MDKKTQDCYLPVNTRLPPLERGNLSITVTGVDNIGNERKCWYDFNSESWANGHGEIFIAYWYEKHTNMIVMSKEEYLADKKKTAEGWISVKDRLPELTEPLLGWSEAVAIENYMATVWAYDPNIGQFKAKLTSNGWAEISSKSVNSTVNPTHWQPLPSPPTSTPF